MKRCPLCGARALDAATTCFECLYDFSAMSVKNSTMAVAAGVHPGSGSAASDSPLSPARDERLRLRVTGQSGMRSMLYSKSGVVHISGSPAFTGAVPDITIRRVGGRTMLERVSSVPVTLGGIPIHGEREVRSGEVVRVGTISIEALDSAGVEVGQAGAPLPRVL